MKVYLLIKFSSEKEENNYKEQAKGTHKYMEQLKVRDVDIH